MGRRHRISGGKYQETKILATIADGKTVVTLIPVINGRKPVGVEGVEGVLVYTPQAGVRGQNSGYFHIGSNGNNSNPRQVFRRDVDIRRRSKGAYDLRVDTEHRKYKRGGD